MSRSPAAGAIPTDPLIEAIDRRLESILALAATLFVVYVTCFPMVGASTAVAAQASMRLSLQDTAQNVLLYLPIGLFWALALRRRQMPWPRIVPLVIVGAAILALTAERLQSALPGRVSSRADVLCNATGATIGVLAALLWRRFGGGRRALRERLRRMPVSATCTTIGLLYAAMAMMPFELDLTPTANAALFDATRLTAITPARAATLWSVEGGRALMDHWMDVAAGAGVFVLLGGLSWWSLRREYGFRALPAIAVLLWLVCGLTAMVLGAQLFVRHAGFAALSATVNPLAALCGVAACMVLGGTAERRWPRVCVVAAACCAGLIAGRELNPFEIAWPEGLFSAFNLIPLQRSFNGTAPLHASGDLLARFGYYAVLGILVAAAVSGPGVDEDTRPRLRRGLAACAGLAITLETLQLVCPARSADLTHILAAIAGAGCGLLAASYWMTLGRLRNGC